METENRKCDVDFLEHYGTLGMKWGERRYQNKDGSLTEEGRRHWGVGPARTKRKSFRLETPEERRNRIVLKQKRKEKKKEEKVEKQEQKNIEKKIRLINKGDREEIYRNRKLFTDEELRYALNRIELTEKFGTSNKNFIEQKVDKVRNFAKDPLTTIEQYKKDQLISKGNMSDIFKNRNLFTDDELRTIISRLDILSKLDPKDRKKANDAQKSSKDGKSKVETIINNLGNATKIVGGVGGLAIAGWKAYEQVAAVTNEAMGTFIDNDKRSSMVEALQKKNTSDSKINFLNTFLEKTLSDGLPVGVIDPDNRLKIQKTKVYSEKEFKKLLDNTDLSDQDMVDLYNKIYGG